MVPLINVIFLITIFIVMLINFSEALIKKVNLPNADEASEISEQIDKKVLIIVKSQESIFLGSKMVSIADLEEALWNTVLSPKKCTVQFRGDENIPYSMVQTVLQKVAALGISRIEFAAQKEAVIPLEEDM
jgi:biopolymer transport protein ExbD